jgi:cytochrome c oxidase assembly factor CtaG
MTTWKLLASTWSWDPSVIVGCAVLLVGYVLLVRSRWTPKSWYFVAGVLVLFVTLECPLDRLGDDYLFSAHMAQHLFLLFVVPPLLILGTPRWLAEWVVDQPPMGRIEKFLSRPLVAWTVGMATEWAWHLPLFYNAALANENIHAFQHISFLVTATIFWWPALKPIMEDRLAPLPTIVYYFLAGAANSILGVILTYSPADIYPTYVHPVDSLGALSLIRDQWGISAELDHQFGGLLMWVGGMTAFLYAIVGALARWYSTPEEDMGQHRIMETRT